MPGTVGKKGVLYNASHAVHGTAGEAPGEVMAKESLSEWPLCLEAPSCV